MTAVARRRPSDPFRVVSAPIDWVLSPAEVRDWIKSARCGDRLRYAQGRQLVRGETSKLMRDLKDAGDVHLFQTRSASGDGFDYLAIRNRVKVEVPGPRRQVGPVLTDLESAIFLKLKACARLGQRCPSDADLANAFDASRNQVGWALRKLVQMQLIDKRVEPTAKDPKFRVVRIVGTDRETARPGQ